MIYDVGGSIAVKNVPVSVFDRKKFCISEDDVIQLAKWAVIIEDHYTGVHGHFCPMDIEWAKDGVSKELFIVQGI